MPFDLDNLKDLTVNENDAFSDYLTGLPEYQAGTPIVAEKFGKLSRAKFELVDGVLVLDYDVNNRFKLVPDGAGGMELMQQFRANGDRMFSTNVALKNVVAGYYVFPDLIDYDVGELFLSVVKLED